MSIEKIYSEPADIAGSDFHFLALYNTLHKASEEGIDGILYLCEEVAPILSVCNCVKTLEAQLKASRFSATEMERIAARLEVNPMGFNPPVREIRHPHYCFDIPSDFGKTVVLICLEAILSFDGPRPCPALRVLRRLNDAHPKTEQMTMSFLSAYLKNYLTLRDDSDSKPHVVSVPVARERPHRYISIDRLFAVAGNIYRAHPEQAQLFTDIIYTAVQEESGSDTDRAMARARQLMAIVSSPSAMAVASRTAEEIEHGELATTSQLALLFHYLFDYLGVNFGNSDKTAWARLIHWITGRNEDNIRKRLSFDFDSRTVKKDLKVVSGYLRELFPSISRQIEKDSHA